MEPLVALSLACNILQVLEVSLGTIGMIRKLRKDNTSDTTVSANSTLLQQITGELQQSIACVQPLTSAEHELFQIATRTAKVARQLQMELHKYGSNAYPMLVDAVRYMLSGKHRIEMLEKSLRELQETLQTKILVNLRYVGSLHMT
jgi:hypothetical protein